MSFLLSKRVCIISSGGGHLTEALLATQTIREKDSECYFISTGDPHIQDRLKGYRVFRVTDPHVSILLYFVNLLQSLWIFMRMRPQVTISTGAGIAISTCLLTKLLGGKLIYVETGAKFRSPSRTGRLLYRFSDVFIVQSEKLLEHYPKAIYGGLLF